MRTFVTLFIVLSLIASTSFAQSPGPETEPNEGMLWIALNLIDQDALGGPGRIQDDWTAPCQGYPPRLLTDGMPHGFRQNHLNQAPRDLPTGICEDILPVQISGIIAGEIVRPKMILWQPSKNGTRWIGVPRQETNRVKIYLPEIVAADAHYYRMTEPIIVRPSGNEALIAIDVPLRRLTEVYVSCTSCKEEQLREISKRHIAWMDDGRAVMEYGVRTLTAPTGKRLKVHLIDVRGRRRAITSPMHPEVFLEVSANYGWQYVVEIIPRKNPADTIARTHLRN